MSALSELIDQGIHAFTRGQMIEAERCWRAALQLDPDNRRVAAYLDQLQMAPFAGSPAEPAVRSSDPVVEKAVLLPPSSPAPGGGRVEQVSSGSRTPVPPPVAVPQASAGPPQPAAVAKPGGEFAPSPWDQGPSAGSTIVLEPGGGLDLSAIAEKSDLRPLVPECARLTPHPVAPKTDVEIWMEGARELFALGDFSGSLEMIEKILKIDPNHPEAWAYLKQNEATLIAMYESKLGSPANVPRLAIKPEEVMWLNLDHRAGFLLAQIDGTVTFEDLFALSGLPRLDTAKILATLLNDGVIR